MSSKKWNATGRWVYTWRRCKDGRHPPPFKGKGAIDPGVALEVRILWENGIETMQSCQGGDGHSCQYPNVQFLGDEWEGFRAFAVALQHGLLVTELRRLYEARGSELRGPWWEIEFNANWRKVGEARPR